MLLFTKIILKNFNCGPSLKSLLNLLQYCFCFLFFLFKYKFIYFNWRLITLQYCIGFAIHQLWLQGMWDFSSQIKDQTHTPGTGT